MRFPLPPGRSLVNKHASLQCTLGLALGAWKSTSLTLIGLRAVPKISLCTAADTETRRARFSRRGAIAVTKLSAIDAVHTIKIKVTFGIRIKKR